MIRIKNVALYLGSLKAVDGVSFEILKGTTTGLIGPNGTEKTTLFNFIAKAFTPKTSQAIFNGEDVTGPRPHQLFKKGLLRTFQVAHEFSSLTVPENLLLVPRS